MIKKITTGFFSPLQGLRIVLSSPKNFIYSLVPFLIGILFIYLIYFFAGDQIAAYVSSWKDQANFFPHWPFLQSIVDAFFFVTMGVLFSVLSFLTGYFCIIIFAGPFYALMVENIFKKELPDKKPRTSIKLILHMFAVGLVKVAVFAVVGIVCFVCAFVPVFNFVVYFVPALLVAFDCSDYAFEVDFLSFGERRRFFFEHFWYYFGLSLAILLISLIPGLFFLLIPAFICGATKMYIQLRIESV